MSGLTTEISNEPFSPQLGHDKLLSMKIDSIDHN